MKKLAIFAVIAIALMATSVYADQKAAVVIDPAGSCGFFDGDGAFVVTEDSRIVATQSANGNITLKCKIKGVPNSTGKAVHYDAESTGLDCAIINPFDGIVLTDDWHETVSASGNATGVCRYKME